MTCRSTVAGRCCRFPGRYVLGLLRLVHYGCVRRVLWLSLTVLGLALLAAVTVYLVRSGVERADKIASSIGAVAGLASLLLGVVQLVRSGSAQPPTSRGPVNVVRGDNQGQLIQTDTIHGNIDMRRRD